jgi:hypothetical protein
LAGSAGRNAAVPSLAAQLLLDNVRGSGDLDFYLSPDEKAPQALDYYLATRVRPSMADSVGTSPPHGNSGPSIAVPTDGLFASRAPLLFDNLGQLQQQYRENLTSYQANRTRVLNTLTTLSFFGGIGLVVFVAMLTLLNIPCGLRLWGPSLGVAAICVVIGAILMDPGRLKSAQAETARFVSYQAPLPTSEPALEKPRSPQPTSFKPFSTTGVDLRPGEKKPVTAKLGETILWQPLTATDAGGKATFQLEFPEPGDYQVFVEGTAELGRLGMAAKSITCEKGTPP